MSAGVGICFWDSDSSILNLLYLSGRVCFVDIYLSIHHIFYMRVALREETGYFDLQWRGGRVVEGAPLLRE